MNRRTFWRFVAGLIACLGFPIAKAKAAHVVQWRFHADVNDENAKLFGDSMNSEMPWPTTTYEELLELSKRSRAPVDLRDISEPKPW